MNAAMKEEKVQTFKVAVQWTNGLVHIDVEGVTYMEAYRGAVEELLLNGDKAVVREHTLILMELGWE